MLSVLRPALVMIVLLTLVTGIIYPLAVTGISQVAFPVQANGSLIEKDGRVLGSSLVGQGFSRPEYFHSRPSGAGEGYDAASSSGSNLAPSAKDLVDRVEADVAAYRAENGAGPVPMDAVTASGSGLDPAISPDNALRQLPRVAAARGIPEAELRALVEEHTERPWLNLLGSPTVAVLPLNLALDERYPVPR